MPSLDDVLDHTDDELLAPEKSLATQETMDFVPTHFGDSDSEEETMSQDLVFPDPDESSLDVSTSEQKMKTEKSHGSDGLASGTGKYISQTLTSVMSSAMKGISTLTTSAIGRSPGKDTANADQPVAFSRDDETDGVKISESHPPKGRGQSESSDVDIAEEFEFLDDYDELTDEENSNKWYLFYLF